MIAIRLIDYVFEQSNLVDRFCENEDQKKKARNISFQRIVDYSRLLNQELKKGMFVPCDLDGEEVKEPNPKKTPQERFPYELQRYNDAKERVLFNVGLIMSFDAVKYRYSTVEGVCNSNYDNEIEFNKPAIKHWIGYNRIDK